MINMASCTDQSYPASFHTASLYPVYASYISQCFRHFYFRSFLEFDESPVCVGEDKPASPCRLHETSLSIHSFSS